MLYFIFTFLFTDNRNYELAERLLELLEESDLDGTADNANGDDDTVSVKKRQQVRSCQDNEANAFVCLNVESLGTKWRIGQSESKKRVLSFALLLKFFDEGK